METSGTLHRQVSMLNYKNTKRIMQQQILCLHRVRPLHWNKSFINQMKNKKVLLLSYFDKPSFWIQSHCNYRIFFWILQQYIFNTHFYSYATKTVSISFVLVPVVMLSACFNSPKFWEIDVVTNEANSTR